MSKKIEKTTDKILGLISESLTHKVGENITPDDLYMLHVNDPLRGKTKGYVSHERRCAIDIKMVDGRDFDVRLYIIKSDRTKVRYFVEDYYKDNNPSQTGRYFTVTMELDKRYYDAKLSRYAVCPNLEVGPPEIVEVLGMTNEHPIKDDLPELTFFYINN